MVNYAWQMSAFFLKHKTLPQASQARSSPELNII
jgi:hypothetical protein